MMKCVSESRTAALLAGMLLGHLILASAGCSAVKEPVSLTPAPPADKQVELERRAIDLLVRAARSDDPVLQSNAMEALVGVAPEDGLPVFREGLRSPSPLVGYAACVSLGIVRDRSSLASLRALAAGPDARVRLGAAFALVRCGQKNYAQFLVDGLSSADENTRCDAAYLIGKLGEPRARRRLRHALSYEESSRVQVHLYTALASLGDSDGVQALKECARDDVVTCVLALQSMVELADPRFRDTLRYCFAKKDYVESQLIAARALGRLGLRDGYALAKENLDATVSDRTDAEATMRRRSLAALALGAIGEPASLPALEQRIRSENDPRVQVAAAYAICEITRKGR